MDAEPSALNARPRRNLWDAERMHTRIGYGIGAVPKLLGEPDGLGNVVDDLDRLGYDSLWFPERNCG